jgi:hypothetical protein
MISQAQSFRNRIEAGEEDALQQAGLAGETTYVVGETGLSVQAQMFAVIASMRSETYSFKIEFSDQSYLLVRLVSGEIESTECGVIQMSAPHRREMDNDVWNRAAPGHTGSPHY